MKIQTLGIIFIIIILPITFALSLYTKTQLDILAQQREYDAKLQATTYDALKAFQINAKNNTQSTLADSKLRDLEASINSFFNSLQANLRIQGYTTETLKEYVPALVYTMYDGYYIYSPYSNVATTDTNGVTIDEEESDNIQYGLKPYVYYSCRYKEKNGNDFVITYSLDNYIEIKGIINGKYVNDSGYLISNIKECTDGMYEYNGIKIEKEEMLTEFIGEKEYPYVKISGTKYYLDRDGGKIFYLLNGTKTTQVDGAINEKLYDQYVNLITQNSSAVRYYKEAYDFTDRVFNEYNLGDLEVSSACNSEGDEIDFEGNTYKYVFDDVDDIPLEYSTSNFNQHRKAVIRYSIESNLSMAIANFNRYSDNVTYDYQMPILKSDDWDTLASNISIISFLQGVDIGGKIYNGYSVVINSETEELVSEEDIYIIGKDGYYHRVEDKYLLEYGTIGEYTNKGTYSKGAIDLDFQVTSMKNTSNTQLLYYYPRKELACYKCVVNQTGINVDFEYSSIYEYLNNIKTDTQSTILRKVYYTVLGRERWGKKFNSVKIEELDKIDIDENSGKETPEIEIELDINQNDYTNQYVTATIKFSENINLDKVVLKIATTKSEAETNAGLAVMNNQFRELTNEEKEKRQIIEIINENSTICVVAYSKNGQDVWKTSGITQIDKQKPETVKIELRKNDGSVYNGDWSAVDVTQYISANDILDQINGTTSGIDRFEYTYDKIKVEGTFDTVELFKDPTNKILSVRAVDKAGNVGDWSEFYWIKIDATPPSVPAVKATDRNGIEIPYDPINGIAVNKDIYIYASAQDNQSGISYYQYSYDGVTPEEIIIKPNEPYVISKDSREQYFLRAINQSGLAGQWSPGYTIQRDTINPGKTQVTLTYADDGSTYTSGTRTNRNVKQYVEAYDLGGVKEYQYRYAGTNQTPHTFPPNPWTISNSPTNVTYEVRAVDFAGNAGEWSNSYQIIIDKEPPVVSNSLIATVQNYNEVVLELKLDNASDIAKIEAKYRVHGSNSEYVTTVQTTNIVTNYQKIISGLEYATTYDMYLVLYDVAGNSTGTNHVYPVTEVAEKDFPYSSSQQTYTVLATGYYQIQAWGSDGADYSGKTGGNGGYVAATFYLTKGQVIKVNTGTRASNYGGTGSSGGNGGGRTDVTADSTLLLVAGGGGGANAYFNGGDGGREDGSYTASATGENGVGAGGGGHKGGKSGSINYHVCDGSTSVRGECYKTPIYHTHPGTSGLTSPNGCYTKPVQTKKTCTVSPGGAGGGDYGAAHCTSCGHGYGTYYAWPMEHSSCGESTDWGSNGYAICENCGAESKSWGSGSDEPSSYTHEYTATVYVLKDNIQECIIGYANTCGLVGTIDSYNQSYGGTNYIASSGTSKSNLAGERNGNGYARMVYVGKTRSASIEENRIDENISIAQNRYKIIKEISNILNAKIEDIQENRKKYLS